MVIAARFAHVNLIARDWRRLARFYQQVLGCIPVPPERKLEGEPLERGTGIRGAALEGVHLRLPGLGDGGPTLEIFEYRPSLAGTAAAVNQLGFGHLAFAVGDVEVARDAVLAAGGHSVGDVVTLAITSTRSVQFAYVTDPEGNIVELQRWLTQPGSEGRRSGT